MKYRVISSDGTKINLEADYASMDWDVDRKCVVIAFKNVINDAKLSGFLVGPNPAMYIPQPPYTIVGEFFNPICYYVISDSEKETQ